MENTETPLSKAEYNYIRTIEKADELIAKLTESLQKERSVNAELASANAELSKKVEVLQIENEKLRAENATLKADLLETTAECQLHVDNIEAQNDDVLKQNEELKAQVLPEERTEKKVEKIKEERSLMDIIYNRKPKK
jgi:hypothetical protein